MVISRYVLRLSKSIDKRDSNSFDSFVKTEKLIYNSRDGQSTAGKSQYRRQCPDRKIVDSPFMIESENSRLTLNPKKIIAICPSPHTVINFGQKSEKLIIQIFLDLGPML